MAAYYNDVLVSFFFKRREGMATIGLEGKMFRSVLGKKSDGMLKD